MTEQYDMAGQVEKSSVYERSGAQGIFYSYSIKIRADDGNVYDMSALGNNSYSPVNEADRITCKITVKDKDGKQFNNIVKGTLKGGTGTAPAMPGSAASPAGGPAGGPAGNRPGAPAASGASPAGGNMYDGQAVGNALNVAAAILGVGTTVETLVATAQRVLDANVHLCSGKGAKAKAAVNAPAPQAQAQAQPQAPAQHQAQPQAQAGASYDNSFDDDIPF